MHYLQKNILDKLRTQPDLSYTDLHPKHLESSHFRYHLLQLQNDGLITKTNKSYSLTVAGKSYVDRLSSSELNPKLMPKVITYTLLESGDSYLLHEKSKEPYKDLLNLIGGKVHYDEFTEDAAKRELVEKAEVVSEEIKFHGTAEIKISSDSELLSHVIAYVYSAQTKDRPESLTAIDKSEVSSRSDLAPDCLKLIEMVESKDATSIKMNLTI